MKRIDPNQFPLDHDAPPVNPLPVSVVVIAGAMFLIELVLTAGASGLFGGPGAVGWRLAAMEQFGFYEPLFSWMAETGTLKPEYLMRLVTYPFVHPTFTSAVFAAVFVLALGKMVGEQLGEVAVLVVFFGATVFGALGYWAIWDTRLMLIGGFPGAYGLIGGFTFLLWSGRVGHASGLQAFTLIAFLMGLQLLFGLLFGGSITWVAELVGFIAGFALAALMTPGARMLILDRLRRR